MKSVANLKELMDRKKASKPVSKVYSLKKVVQYGSAAAIILLAAVFGIMNYSTSNDFSLSRGDRLNHNEKLMNLKPIGEEFISKEVETSKIKLLGFNDYSEYNKLIESNLMLYNNLEKEFPLFGKMDSKSKGEYFKKAIGSFINEHYENANKLKANCSAVYSAEKQKILATATGALLACGATAAGLSTILSPVGGGAFYGACAGTVYSVMNAELELAEIEYEEYLQE
ncbi:hypothetical protein [Gracilimonas sp.]|uniref:hypothetical protein n=1 Tax=Gracilimonas sp. TaxID=1974203 RepID=UPI002871F50D|nr:hypothetical protein [Gracilimonas sp.]